MGGGLLIGGGLLSRGRNISTWQVILCWMTSQFYDIMLSAPQELGFCRIPANIDKHVHGCAPLCLLPRRRRCLGKAGADTPRGATRRDPEPFVWNLGPEHIRSWVVTFIPTPMPKTVCITNLYNKMVQLEVCWTCSGRAWVCISQLRNNKFELRPPPPPWYHQPASCIILKYAILWYIISYYITSYYNAYIYIYTYIHMYFCIYVYMYIYLSLSLYIYIYIHRPAGNRGEAWPPRRPPSGLRGG